MRRLILLCVSLILLSTSAIAQTVGQGAGGTSPWRVDFGGTAQPVTQSGAWTFSFTTAQPVTQSGTWHIGNITGTVSLPSGAATAAKQPAFGTAGTASADVITVQGIASMTALKVDGSGVTQPVSGTFWQATQPVSASSLPLPAGASTLAEQQTQTTALQLIDNLPVTQGSTTSGQSGLLAQGAVTTAAPSYTTAQTSPLSLTTTGLLRVDGSAVTQPVSGTVTTTPPANASTNVAQLAGTTTDTNSGTKSAGTLRVVLATDQPALTNKLLVTPDSVALPANQSVNVSQINGVTTTMGNGISGTGVQRVTLASDSTGQVTLATGSNTIGALTANQSVNVAQVNGVATSTGNGVSGAGVQRVAIASDNTAFAVNNTQQGTASQNVTQFGGTNVSTGTGAGGSGVPRVTVSNDSAVVQGTAAADTASWPVKSGTVAAGTAAWTSATSIDSTLALTVTGYNMVAVSLRATSSMTGGTLNFEASDDAGTNWYTIGAVRVDTATAETTFALSVTNKLWQAGVGGLTSFRVRLNPAITGTGTANLRMQASNAKPETAIVARQATASDLQMTATQSGTWAQNVTQFGGTNVSTGTGAGGAGIPRVTISNDSSLAANQSVNVAQINGVTTLMGNGVTGTGSQRVTLASDNSAVSGLGAGATGSAVPTNAVYVGLNENGNTKGAIQCDKTAKAAISSATTTALVAVSGSTTIYVCSYVIEIQGVATTAGTNKLVYGTGATCGTGTTDITPDYIGNLTAGAPTVISQNAGQGYLFKTIASQALCSTSTTTTVQKVFITYAQF